MSNTIDKIRYTTLNGIMVPELSDIVAYIGQQGHTTEYVVKAVKNDGYDRTLTITQVKDGVTSEVVYGGNLVTTDTPQYIASNKIFNWNNGQGPTVQNSDNTEHITYNADGFSHISNTGTGGHSNSFKLPEYTSYQTKTLAVTDDLPTKTSELTNDSGFITISSVPTKTSQLTNDSGFLTSSSLNNYVTTDTAQDINAAKRFTVSPIINRITCRSGSTDYVLSVPTQTSTLATVSDLAGYVGIAADNTITGLNTFTNSIISSKTGSAIRRDVDTSYLQLVGGTDTSGARFSIYGKSHDDYAGWIAMVADDASTENKYYIKPNGTFLFNDYITIKPKDNGVAGTGTTKDAIYATNGTAGSSSWLSNVFFASGEGPIENTNLRYSVLITRHSGSNGVIYAFPFSANDAIYQCRRSGGSWNAWKSISFS